MLYLTSDGFVDQPNAERQKIGGKQLVTCLTDNANFSMLIQKQTLEEILKNYKTGTMQRDDITILGVKL